MTPEALDDVSGARMVGADDLAQILGVEPAGQDGRVREVAEHHRQLAPPCLADILGRRRQGRGGSSRGHGRRGGLRPREIRRRREAGHGLGRPDEALPVLVAGKSLEGELLLRGVQERLVAVEDVRERLIGHAALALQKRDEGRQRRVYAQPSARDRFSGRARGGLEEGRAAGLAKSCADHRGETTTAGDAYETRRG